MKNDLYTELRKFASMMAHTYDISDVLNGVAESIADVLRADGAGVAVADDEGRLRFVTATGPDVEAIEHVQDSNQAGPCVEAFRSGRPVVVPDITTVDGWKEYRGMAERVGFRSVLGVPLRTRRRRFGSINVFDREVRHWTDEDLVDAGVLADISTGYILHAGELRDAKQLNGQLREAIETRDIIGQAKGILMAAHDVDSDAAFEILRTTSQARNIKLRDLAAEVATGTDALREVS